jgi:hypothetical protein
MNLETLMSIIATFFGLFSAFFLSKGVIKSTPQVIAKQSITKYDYNINIMGNLTSQKSDYYTGFGLLFITFIIQIINLLDSKRLMTIIINYRTGIFIIIIIAISILLISFFINWLLFKIFLKQTKRCIVVERLDSLFTDINKKFYSAIYYFSTINHGSILFGINKSQGESNYEYLVRFCKYFNYEVPNDLDIDKINCYKNDTE